MPLCCMELSLVEKRLTIEFRIHTCIYTFDIERNTASGVGGGRG